MSCPRIDRRIQALYEECMCAEPGWNQNKLCSWGQNIPEPYLQSHWMTRCSLFSRPPLPYSGWCRSLPLLYMASSFKYGQSDVRHRGRLPLAQPSTPQPSSHLPTLFSGHNGDFRTALFERLIQLTRAVSRPNQISRVFQQSLRFKFYGKSHLLEILNPLCLLRQVTTVHTFWSDLTYWTGM